MLGRKREMEKRNKERETVKPRKKLVKRLKATIKLQASLNYNIIYNSDDILSPGHHSILRCLLYTSPSPRDRG